ncbi:hypothetical protein ACLOJK_002931 [Asimina triloba]
MAERGAMGQPDERQLEEQVSLLEQCVAGLVADTESVESNGSNDLGAKLAGLTERMDFYDVKHEEMMAKFESLTNEVAVLKRDFLESSGRGEGRKTKVPNPSPYSSVWNAKELENFIFDMK